MRVYLFSANVGSLFENPDLVDPFVSLFSSGILCDVAEQRPDFVACHLQELGGKIKAIGRTVTALERALGQALAPAAYDRSPILYEDNLDGEFSALGLMFFVRRGAPCRILDHASGQFVAPPPVGSGLWNRLWQGARFSGTKHRKGWQLTRWQLDGRVNMDLCNVHLFADELNSVARSGDPTYRVLRRDSLAEALSRVAASQKKLSASAAAKDSPSTDTTAAAAAADDNVIPLFVFGDFNFRLHWGPDLDQWLGGPDAVACASDRSFELSETGRAHFFGPDGLASETRRLFDRELADCNADPALKPKLHDVAPVTWGPSFPTVERSRGVFYPTRCPAWPDRILANVPGIQLAQQQQHHSQSHLIYSEAWPGKPTPVDHVPVKLEFCIGGNAAADIDDQTHAASQKKRKL